MCSHVISHRGAAPLSGDGAGNLEPSAEAQGGPYLESCAKMTSAWVEELRVRPQSVRHLDENRGQMFTTSHPAETSWICHRRHRHQRKNRQIGPHENLNLLCLEGPRVGEYVCKSYLRGHPLK